MKIPASSSILLATLAVSSSSSCLAAPAGDGSQDTGISPSSSTSRVHWDHTGHCPPSSDTPAQQKSDAMRRAYASNLENRDTAGVLKDAEGQVAGLVQKVLPAPLGTTIANIIQSLSVNANSSDGGAAQGIDPQSVEAISAAAQEASRMANNNGTASTTEPAQNVNGTLPVNSQNDSSDQRSAPPSPNLPANPHNTPNPGVHAQADAPTPPAGAPAPPAGAPAPPAGAPAPPAGAPAPPAGAPAPPAGAPAPPAGAPAPPAGAPAPPAGAPGPPAGAPGPPAGAPALPVTPPITPPVSPPV